MPRVAKGMATQVFPHGVDLPFIPTTGTTSVWVMLCVGSTVGECVVFVRFLWVGIGPYLQWSLCQAEVKPSEEPIQVLNERKKNHALEALNS